jgi:VWFA-related protein
MRTEETAQSFTLKAQRNEVLVRVVVRAAGGKAVGTLTKDDFHLYDNGKPQAITVFSVESSIKVVSSETAKPRAPDVEPQPELKPPPATAQRFVAFYFDDIVMSFEDLGRTRDAAERYLQSSLQPTDRASIFTSSGLGDLDFTDDRDKLREALAHLKPHPVVGRPESDCPPLSPYEAYVIAETRDQQEIEIATLKVIQCACGGDPTHCPNPQQQAESRAAFTWNNDEMQSRQSLRVLASLVRRLALLPGQRTILWVSQGFLAITLQQEVAELADRALRNRVVINALDARGLYALVPGGDATQSSDVPLSPLTGLAFSGPGASARLVSIQSTGQSMNADVMAEVTQETGGVFFHNNNDYDTGFRQAGALPEFSYLLGFSPQNLKYDGKYHKLKVELVDGKSYTVQARRGYYAPSQAPDAPERIQEEIQQAVFSQDELQELPVEISTQFFKTGDQSVKLSVVAHVDVRSLRFRKAEGRNVDDLTTVVAVFDRDGNLVDGRKKLLELRLRDATLEKLTQSGLGMKTGFDVKPGTYLVRVVVRDSESGQLSALNRAVEIPY